MTLQKRILKNGLASSFQKVSTILYQLLLVPFFIKFWGADYYGEWLTLTIIPSLFAFADFGFGSAAASSMVLTYAKGQKQSFIDMAKTGRLIITCLIIFLLLFSFVTVFILNQFHIFDKSLIDANEAMLAVLLLITARIINFYQQLYEAFFRAAQKAHKSIYLLSIFQISNVILSVLVLTTGGKVVDLSLFTLLLSLFFLPTYIISARRSLPIHQSIKGSYSKSIASQFIKTGFGYLMDPLWQIVLYQGTTFAVRIVLGPMAVTLYSTVRTVTNIPTQLVSVILGSTFPDLQFELGAGRITNAQKIFKYVILVAAFIGVGSSIFLIFFGEWFYKVWTAKALNPPTLMWVVFMCSIIFKAIWWGAVNIFRALNQPYQINVPCLLVSVFSVTLTYLLIPIIGITGVAIGALLMDVSLFLYVFPKATTTLSLKVNEILNDLFQIKCFVRFSNIHLKK